MSVTFPVTTNFNMRQHLLPILAAQVAQLLQDGASTKHKKVFSTSLKTMEEIPGDCCYMRRAGPELQKPIMPAPTAGPILVLCVIGNRRCTTKWPLHAAGEHVCDQTVKQPECPSSVLCWDVYSPRPSTASVLTNGSLNCSKQNQKSHLLLNISR